MAEKEFLPVDLGMINVTSDPGVTVHVLLLEGNQDGVRGVSREREQCPILIDVLCINSA